MARDWKFWTLAGITLPVSVWDDNLINLVQSAVNLALCITH